MWGHGLEMVDTGREKKYNDYSCLESEDPLRRR